MLSLALALLLAPVSADEVREIQSPLFGQPAFVLPGGTIPVQLRSGKAMKAVLRDSSTGRLAAEALDSSAFTLPDSVPPGMYDLCAAGDCQPHSVVVVKSFDPPFIVAHVTDYHVGDPRAERAFPGMDIRKVRLAALERASESNPAFILLTGDVNAYPETYRRDYPASAKELIAHAKAPLVILPGNHDFYATCDEKGEDLIDGTSYWPRYFGPAHRILDYGPFRFIGFNTYDWPLLPRISGGRFHAKHGTAHTWEGTLSRSEYAWVMEALETTGGRIPVLAAHHDPRYFERQPLPWCQDCVGPERFLSALAERKVPYYVFGHVHVNEEFTDKGIRFIGTGSVGSDADPKELWSIRLLKFKADRTLETEVIRLFDSPPKG